MACFLDGFGEGTDDCLVAGEVGGGFEIFL